MTVVSAVLTVVCTRVGVPGWVYRVGRQGGYTGVLPSHRGEVPSTAKRAPEAPWGLEWVVLGTGRAPGTVGGDGPVPPYGPGRSTPGGPPCTGPCRLPTYGQRGEN